MKNINKLKDDFQEKQRKLLKEKLKNLSFKFDRFNRDNLKKIENIKTKKQYSNFLNQLEKQIIAKANEKGGEIKKDIPKVKELFKMLQDKW